MSDDSDDLDAVLRRTMASLDRQVPAGYFEALPARTLARLDDPAIGAAIGPLGDAGLQDIRDLASETRARLSSQHAAQGAPGSTVAWADDAAVSSGSKSIAMPGPTRAAAEVDAPASASLSPPASAALQPPAVAVVSAAPASAVSQPPTSVAGAAGRPAAAVSQPSRPAPPLSPTAVPVDASASAAPRRGRRAAWAALAGGLAAVAVGYVALGSRKTERADLALVNDRSAAQPATTLSADHDASKGGDPVVVARGSLEPALPAAATAPTPAAPPVSGAANSSAEDLRKQGSRADKLRKTGGDASSVSPRPPARGALPGGTGGTAAGAIAPSTAPPILKRPPPANPVAKAGPSSDPLAPGAGAGATPPGPPAGYAAASGGSGSGSGAAAPPLKPRPARTSLSTDDIKRGMTAVAGKAKACFNGTQGLAALRLTVAPSGRVVKAAVTGMFAGSPTGACVERAAAAARFPAWDGGPQSFHYSYLLSD